MSYHLMTRPRTTMEEPGVVALAFQWAELTLFIKEIAEAFTSLDSCSEPLSNFWVMSKWKVTAASFCILEAALVDEGELH